MSNKTDLQENNVILSNSAEGLLGGLSKVKNALQDKKVTVNQSGKIPTFNELRDAIETGVTDLSDTTAQANDVATGKVFYDKDGNKTEGSGKIAKTIAYNVIGLPEEYPVLQYSSLNTLGLTTGNSDGVVFLYSSSTSIERGVYLLNKDNGSWDKLLDKAKKPDSYKIYKDTGDMFLYFSATKTLFVYDNVNKKLIQLSITKSNVSPKEFVFSNEEHIYLLSQYDVLKINRVTEECSYTHNTSLGNTSPTLRYKDYVLLSYFGHDTVVLFNTLDGTLKNLNTSQVSGNVTSSNLIYIKEVDLLYLSPTKNDVNYDNLGILVFNDEIEDFEKIVEYGSGYDKYFISSNNEVFIWSRNARSSNYTLKYSKNDKTFVNVDGAVLTYYTSLFEANDGIYLYNKNNTDKGLYKYNLDNTFYLIESTSDLLVYNLKEVSSNLIISSNSSSALGVYLLNTETLSLTPVLSTGYGSFNIIESSYGLFFSWSSSSYKGVYLFDLSTYAYTTLSTSEYGAKFYYDGSNIIIIPDSTNRPIYYYNGQLNSFGSNISANVSATPKFRKIFNLLFIYDGGTTKTSRYRIIILDYSDMSLKYLSETYFNPDIYEENGEIVIKNSIPSKLEYYDSNGNFLRNSSEYIFGSELFKASNTYQYIVEKLGVFIGKDGALVYESGSFSNYDGYIKPSDGGNKFIYFTEEQNDN